MTKMTYVLPEFWRILGTSFVKQEKHRDILARIKNMFLVEHQMDQKFLSCLLQLMVCMQSIL